VRAWGCWSTAGGAGVLLGVLAAAAGKRCLEQQLQWNREMAVGSSCSRRGSARSKQLQVHRDSKWCEQLQTGRCGSKQLQRRCCGQQAVADAVTRIIAGDRASL
jgi:hypothetical protein